MTHGFSSTDKSKKPMNMYYDFSNGKVYAYDSNETLQEVNIGGGGSGMMVADTTSFATGSNSGSGTFTAQEAGFIVGNAYATPSSTQKQSATINGVEVVRQESVTGSFTTGYGQAYIPYKTGDNIVITGTNFKAYKAVPME